MIYNRSLQDDYLDYKRDEDNLFPFLLGRNAFNYLIKSLEIKAILLPSYICSMVVDIFKHHEVEIFFYENLNKQLEVPLNDIFNKLRSIESSNKIFFLWHDYLNIIGDMPDELYDYLENNNIESIVDAAHSLPIKDYRCPHVIYGFRKLLNQPFGSLLQSKRHHIKTKNCPLTKIWLFSLAYRIKTIFYLLLKNYDNKICNGFLKILSSFDGLFSFDKRDNFLYDEGSGNYTDINGTQGNGEVEGYVYPDSEDLDGDYLQDFNNDYFTYSIRPLIDAATDSTQYSNGNNTGWKLYRINLSNFKSLYPEAIIAFLLVVGLVGSIIALTFIPAFSKTDKTKSLRLSFPKTVEKLTLAPAALRC